FIREGSAVWIVSPVKCRAKSDRAIKFTSVGGKESPGFLQSRTNIVRTAARWIAGREVTDCGCVCSRCCSGRQKIPQLRIRNIRATPINFFPSSGGYCLAGAFSPANADIHGNWISDQLLKELRRIGDSRLKLRRSGADTWVPDQVDVQPA